MKKRILILTASFGEGHNSAARGIRDALARVAPEGTEVELHDLFAEAYGPVNELVRKSYLGGRQLLRLAHGVPFIVGSMARRISIQNSRVSRRLEEHFAALLERFQPDVIDLHVPCLSLAYFDRIRARNPDTAALQKRRCSHGFDYHQRGLVPLRRRLFPRRQTNRVPLSCRQPESPWKKSRCLVSL